MKTSLSPSHYSRRKMLTGMTYGAALLILVDRGVVSLDDPVSTWLPQLPDSDQATLRMLINMTADYGDYVTTNAFSAVNAADPFRHWTPEEFIAIYGKKSVAAEAVVAD